MRSQRDFGGAGRPNMDMVDRLDAVWDAAELRERLDLVLS